MRTVPRITMLTLAWFFACLRNLMPAGLGTALLPLGIAEWREMHAWKNSSITGTAPTAVRSVFGLVAPCCRFPSPSYHLGKGTQRGLKVVCPIAARVFDGLTWPYVIGNKNKTNLVLCKVRAALGFGPSQNRCKKKSMMLTYKCTAVQPPIKKTGESKGLWW